MLNNEDAVSTVAMLWAPPKSADSSTNQAVSVAAVGSSATSGMRNTRATASPQGLSSRSSGQAAPRSEVPGPRRHGQGIPREYLEPPINEGIDTPCRDLLP